MKTIVNKIRFALLLSFLAMGMTVLAQDNPNVEKLTISTQMFLDEMAGRISFDEPSPTTKGTGLQLIEAGKPAKRPIAWPDTIDGKVYISAFIKVAGDEYIPEVEALGVKIMCTFDDGLMTANIPIDMIEQVAEIEGVIRIEVAELMEEATDLARQASNVDDVLTLSQDAQLAGLQQIYDGSGVVLAIIDNGIDFQHIAFKDKNGNPRIKRVYKWDGSSATEWTGSGTLPTADATTTDHGTHTSSIAGGSSVIVNGTDITVTDDHTSATYGGMAPGADLYLAGINSLNSTYIVNAFQKIVDYADAQGKPVVVSNSWSNSYGPRDGYYTGSNEEIVRQLFGESHPNRICLFAAANRAGNADASEGGGLYATGTASQSNPLASILRYHRYSNADNGFCYNSTVLDAWGRSTSNLGINIYVLDSNTGDILKSVSYTPTGTTTVSGLSDYYDGTLTIYTATNSNTGKHQIRLQASNFESKGYDYDSANNYYTSYYTLAVEVYPTSGSCIVDMWGGGSGYFTNYLTTSGHNWVLGSDDVSVSDHAIMPEVISVGSYITRQGGTAGNQVGDISPFSGYAVEGVGPLGTMQPWICAPGQLIVSAYNHSYTGRSSEPLINNTTNPYGTAQGTSMATPAAAGIVALWMQAANECGHQLTLSEVKNIMKVTAIHDYFTDSGSNTTHFGNGKIDALAGIEYILNQYAVPTINADPTEVTFDTEPNQPRTQTVAVSGLMLTGDITATLNDNTGTYSINTTNLGSGGNLVITYAPVATGNHNATITLTSPGANPVTITINGICAIKADTTICDGTNTNGYLPIYGFYYDEKQVNQMIYPASMLNGIKGKRIKSMKFYSSSGIKFSEGKFNASIGTTTQSTFGSQYSRITTGMTQVATDQVAVSGGTELLITFDEPFEYNSGNLVIDFEVTTAGNYGNAQTYFYGVNQSSYTSFNSHGSSKDSSRGVYTGRNSGRRQFLPKVTFEFEVVEEPVTSGTVSPNALTYSDVIIGKSRSQTVTVTNTGNQNFTPVIDTTGLPSEFTVTGNGEVLPNGSINLTVTYTPTDEGPHSGSFTVTIGDQTYTVTVTGNGIVVNTTLVSNEIMVPVYKSDLESAAHNIYSANDIANDEHMALKANSGDYVTVLVKNEEAVTRYNVERKANNEDEWTVVAMATHEEGNTFMPRNNDMTAQGDAVAFDGGATEMWLPVQDNVPNAKTVTMYVPVTVADGKITQDNTYGAARRTRATDDIAMTIHVGGSKSDKRWGGHWNQALPDGTTADYCVYTPVITITTSDLDGETRMPYMFRAWLISEGAYNFDRDPETTGIVGTTPLESPYLLGEQVLTDVPSVQQVVIGENWDPETSPVRLQNAFGAPVSNARIEIVVRAYYHLVNSNANMLRDANDDTPMFRFSQEGTEGYFDLPTGIIDLIGDRQVASVTYVNTLGMQSSQPFDGVNIVVTRYNDGSIMTSKVIR